jgi:hypothetical protein
MLGSAAGASVARMAIATDQETAASHTEWEQRLEEYVQRARDAATPRWRCGHSIRRPSTGSSGR